jgi:hypothetical protein
VSNPGVQPSGLFSRVSIGFDGGFGGAGFLPGIRTFPDRIAA